MPPRPEPRPLHEIARTGNRRAVLVDGRVRKEEIHGRPTRILGMRLHIPLALRSLRKFGRFSANRAEWINYTRYFTHVPTTLRDSFARVLELTKERGKNVLYMEPVVDFDGTISRSVLEYQRVHDLSFWRKLDEAVEYMAQQGIAHYGLKGPNILVRRKSETELVPVIIDYKLIGAGRYPRQPWLWFGNNAVNKMRRKYERFKREYSGLGDNT